MVTDILGKVIERGTAAATKSLGFTKPAAGKTGTTNDYHDAWFVGFTTSLTCGVGLASTTPQTIVSRGYGAALALPIWTEVMNSAPNTRYPATAFPPPGPLASVAVCATSNELATTGCERARTAYSIELPSVVYSTNRMQYPRRRRPRRGAAGTGPSSIRPGERFPVVSPFFGGE
jgi:penicillin-binding protein 1A